MGSEARASATDALLAEFWPRARPTLLARLEAVERGVADRRGGRPADEPWRLAGRAAHALASSLALLGHLAAPLAGDLDGLLKDGPGPGRAHAAAELVAALRRALDAEAAPTLG